MRQRPPKRMAEDRVTCPLGKARSAFQTVQVHVEDIVEHHSTPVQSKGSQAQPADRGIPTAGYRRGHGGPREHISDGGYQVGWTEQGQIGAQWHGRLILNHVIGAAAVAEYAVTAEQLVPVDLRGV